MFRLPTNFLPAALGLLFALGLLIAAPMASAQTPTAGRITMLFVAPERGIAMVHHAAPTKPATAPACATFPTTTYGGVGYGFRLDSAAGRAMLNQLLHAQTMGYSVDILGNNTCGNIWSNDREEVLWVRIQYP